ncbi:MAG: hypothetical protein QXT16_08680 [Candidatus Caldarchaeum sp.]
MFGEKKRKYWEKTHTQDGLTTLFLRHLQSEPLFSEYAWLQIGAFDLSQLGMGILYDILPVEFEPYSVDFRYVEPTLSETMQGIWVKFEPFPFAKAYPWMAEFSKYVFEGIKEEFQPDLLIGHPMKAIYGKTPYARGVYDPPQVREFLRATFYRLRLLRTSTLTWATNLAQIRELLKATEEIDENLWNRLFALLSGQTNAFVLGLSLLGRSFLTYTENGLGVVPVISYRGEELDVKFKTLDHLQMGFILGLTPLGFGLLMPLEGVYKLKEGGKNPIIIESLETKIKGMINRLSLSTFAYPNYNKPEEMIDLHRSEKVGTFDQLWKIREAVERWVETVVPPEESSAFKLRMYKSAVLEAIGWRKKRHAWGYKAWERMTEEEFRDWWVANWEAQGLRRDVLLNLFIGSDRWREPIRQDRFRLGVRVRQLRERLALLE